MTRPDPRGERLRAFDGHAQAFSAASAQRIELGARHAEGDAVRLMGLAAAIAAGVADWRGRIKSLEVGAGLAFNEARARTLLMESVFDVLTLEAWRVLAAALDLVCPPA
ncbi:MAG: hypothetical protein ACR2F8_12335 [Caulobacteraceae bacterium]